MVAFSSTGIVCHTINTEGGAVLLDEMGTGELRELATQVWGRIQVRRAFMEDSLGIRRQLQRCSHTSVVGLMA